MRRLLSSAKLRPGQVGDHDLLVRTYSTAMSSAATEILELWVQGLDAPKPEAHLVPCELVDSKGVVVGFNVYLVWGEIQVLGGRMPREDVGS